MVLPVLCLYLIQVHYMSSLQLATYTSWLHVSALTRNLHEYATCFRLNPAVKFYFRMELISSFRYLISNDSFSVFHCAVGPTYLVSSFHKHGLCSGISHFLHHR